MSMEFDPQQLDPNQLQRVHKQKMEAVKLLMTEIIDNPSTIHMNELKQVIDYLDKDSDNKES